MKLTTLYFLLLYPFYFNFKLKIVKWGIKITYEELQIRVSGVYNLNLSTGFETGSMDSRNKLKYLNEKLAYYQKKLAEAMIGYRGVRHESASSEIKHDKVMVLRAMVDQLKEEIQKLTQS